MKNPLKSMAVAAFALMIAVPAAFAQITPEASILPVTEPLDVGGTILQPGTYTIHVLPSFQGRNKIQVRTQAGEIVATALTVPHELEPGEEVPNTTFVYYPAGDGMPRALRTWFAPDPPGHHGHDIVYEEDRAKQLARLANARVVSVPVDANIETDTTLSVVTPEATVETYTYVAPTTPVETQTTTVTETTTTEVETPSTMASQSTQVEMPATASNLPLIALLGLVSLAGAIAIRIARS